jgi:hypothetical protein
MTYHFIYTNIGNAPRPADKFDWSTMRSVAPSGSYETHNSDIHKIGSLLNNRDLMNAVVVEIKSESEAVVFKMMQDTFIYHAKEKPKLEHILVDVDWPAVFAEGVKIPTMALEQENRKAGQLQVTRMMKVFNKYYDSGVATTFALGKEHNDELMAYSQKLDQIVEQYRTNNTAETAKLAKERAKVKKKLLSFKAK